MSGTDSASPSQTPWPRGEETLPRVIERLVAGDPGAWDSIAALRKDVSAVRGAVPRLVELLKDGDKGVRQRALAAICLLGPAAGEASSRVAGS